MWKLHVYNFDKNSTMVCVYREASYRQGKAGRGRYMVGLFLLIFLVFINFTFFIIFVLVNFVFFCGQIKWVDANLCEENSCISTEVFCICAIIFVYFLLNWISHLCNVYVCILQTKKAGRGQYVCGGPSAFLGSGTASSGGGGGRRGPPLKTNRWILNIWIKKKSFMYSSFVYFYLCFV